MSTNIQTTHFATFRSAASAIDAGHLTASKALLGPRPAGYSPRARVDALIHSALVARFDGDTQECGNLYVHNDDDTQRMINAFSLLAERTPLIRFGYVAANQAILAAARDAERVHIVDLGIGAGTQWFDLIDRLAGLPGATPRVRLTGVDIPDAAGEVEQTLRALGERLTAHARTRGVEFSFVGLAQPIETLAGFDRHAGEVLALNASLALHHIAAEEDGESARDHVLRRLAALRPEILTLVEPEADHNHRGLTRRLVGARHHYDLVFSILDEFLADAPSVRGTLEQDFFGRELANILGTDGPERVERHEPLLQWQRRLTAAGFTPAAGELGELETEVKQRSFGLLRRGEAFQLAWRGAPVLSFSAWKVVN